MKWQSVARTHQGLVREKNQDAILDRPDVGIFIVADGMGGEQAGEEASAQVIATATRIINEFFKKTPSGPSVVEGMLRDTLLEANQDVFQISVREPSKRGLGSTTSMLCLHRGVYFIAQVGDSRIYLSRGGQVRQLTRDHTLVWALYEQGALTRDQLETHPERHLLTQCIGSARPIKVDTMEGDAQVGDTFLICSDGLTGYADEARVFEIMMSESLSLGERADKMIDAALKAGGGDNVSAVLIRVETLEADDDWKPEATAPPHKLEMTPAEAIADDDPQLQAFRRAAGRKKKGGPAKPLLGLVAALALGAIVYLALTSRPIKVYLKPIEKATAGSLDQVTVSAADGSRKLDHLALKQDAKGFYFELPGAGNYHVTIAHAGFVPKRVDTTASRGADGEIPIAAWAPLAHVTLMFPAAPQPKVKSVQTIATLADGSNVTQTHEVGGESTMTLELEPGIDYQVNVKPEGGGGEWTQRYELPAGETRTAKVFFDKGGA